MNKRVNIFLMGGSGNVFFQISRAVSLRELGYDVEVIYLSKNYKKIISKVINHTQHNMIVDPRLICKHVNLKIRKCKFHDIIRLCLLYLKRHYGSTAAFDTNLVEFEKQAIALDVGYFQSNEHVSKSSIAMVSSAIQDLLKIRSSPNADRSLIHYRGGDFQATMRPDVNALNALVNNSGSDFKFVTNDVNAVRNLFGSEVEFTTGSSADEDFILLAQASEIFVSQSTFAFWALACSPLPKKEIYIEKNNYLLDLIKTYFTDDQIVIL